MDLKSVKRSAFNYFQEKYRRTWKRHALMANEALVLEEYRMKSLDRTQRGLLILVENSLR